jgi:hypothetical protein
LASTLGANAVGALTALAFVAFLFAYAIFGQWAAGIAFWAVMFGLPAALVLISAVGAVWGGARREEMLEIATLAVELALTRQSELAEKADGGRPGKRPADDRSSGTPGAR